MKETITAIFLAITLLGAAIAILLWSINIKENNMESAYKEKFQTYSTLVVNGEEYNTEDIETVKYSVSSYSDDMIELILKDGSEIRFSSNNYSLKNRKQDK